MAEFQLGGKFDVIVRALHIIVDTNPLAHSVSSFKLLDEGTHSCFVCSPLSHNDGKEGRYTGRDCEGGPSP